MGRHNPHRGAEELERVSCGDGMIRHNRFRVKRLARARHRDHSRIHGLRSWREQVGWTRQMACRSHSRHPLMGHGMAHTRNRRSLKARRMAHTRRREDACTMPWTGWLGRMMDHSRRVHGCTRHFRLKKHHCFHRKSGCRRRSLLKRHCCSDRTSGCMRRLMMAWWSSGSRKLHSMPRWS